MICNIARLVAGEKICSPGSRPPLISVGRTRLPSFASVAKPAARWIGETASPWPKEMVIVERSVHRGGKSGFACAASASSSGNGSNMPKRFR